MQKTSKLLLSGVAGVAALVCFAGMNANAAGRSMVGAAGNSGTSGRAAMNTARMPTMPTMSINTIGTYAGSGQDIPVNNVVPTPTPTPTPEPTPEPIPTDCADGGVRNSTFTVDNCMQSVLSCVQGGALPHGLSDLYNEDLRNSIINGMGICANEVDRCIREVRVDCRNVYDSSTDVWLDFNSRIVQPEYYNFVLRKTGLTPNQAENVCGLLDKNTYGSSFAAVSAANSVTSEYNNPVAAYNGAAGGKANPQGAMVNTTANGNINGVDGSRGHYARWDATNGVCQVRVAAYNKDKLITNNWLFGALGDDRTAEVWRDAGSTFTCSKDLFDFSLLNDTSTVAVVGMGGGTLLGAGIGALVGHGARDFNCTTDGEKLFKEIKANKSIEDTLNVYLSQSIPVTSAEFGNTCAEIVSLYGKYMDLSGAVESCAGTVRECSINYEVGGQQKTKHVTTCGDVRAIVNAGYSFTDGSTTIKDEGDMIKNGLAKCVQACTADKADASAIELSCTFHPLSNKDGRFNDVWCPSEGQGCVSVDVAKREVDDLKKVFNKLTLLKGEESNRVKTTLVGAGIGLGTGGVATAITAFVERNNISCRVGDGLNTVGFGKSFTIDSLKDFYVKWNLHVADSISPTAKVTSCRDWIDTCGMYKTAAECNAVTINYQRPGRNTTTEIRSACRMSGSVCIENRSVAVSYGACTRDGTER